MKTLLYDGGSGRVWSWGGFTCPAVRPWGLQSLTWSSAGKWRPLSHQSDGGRTSERRTSWGGPPPEQEGKKKKHISVAPGVNNDDEDEEDGEDEEEGADDDGESEKDF